MMLRGGLVGGAYGESLAMQGEHLRRLSHLPRQDRSSLHKPLSEMQFCHMPGLSFSSYDMKPGSQEVSIMARQPDSPR